MGIATASFIFLALMCGRTVVSLAPDDMIRACTFRDRKGKRRRPVWRDAPGGQQYRTSYNMAPGSFSPVLVARKHFDFDDDNVDESESDRILTPMKWGLVPSWHQGDPFKVPYETNNCRVEGMLDKKTYKVPLHRGYRCVILVDGFYEWKTTKDGKQPHFFYFPRKDDSALSSGNCEKIIEKPCHVGDTIKEEKLIENSGVSVKEESSKMKEDFTDNDDAELMKLEEFNPTTFIKFENLDSCLNQQSSKLDNPIELDVKDDDIENKQKVIIKQSHSLWDETVQHYLEKASFHLPDKTSSVHIKTTADKTWMHNDAQTDEGADWMGQRPLTIAGVYDIWRSSKTSEPIYSYSVITVPASKDMDWCHHRMPAVLPSEEDVQDWLDSANIPLQKAASLIKTRECLTSHPVSKKVNNSRCQDPDCAKPVDLSVANKPKMTGSSNLMMSWLNKGQGQRPQTPPIKKAKFEA